MGRRDWSLDFVLGLAVLALLVRDFARRGEAYGSDHHRRTDYPARCRRCGRVGDRGVPLEYLVN